MPLLAAIVGCDCWVFCVPLVPQHLVPVPPPAKKSFLLCPLTPCPQSPGKRLHVEVRNACASEEILACVSECLAGMLNRRNAEREALMIQADQADKIEPRMEVPFGVGTGRPSSTATSFWTSSTSMFCSLHSRSLWDIKAKNSRNQKCSVVALFAPALTMELLDFK